jgi:hypothetical protein
LVAQQRWQATRLAVAVVVVGRTLLRLGQLIPTAALLTMAAVVVAQVAPSLLLLAHKLVAFPRLAATVVLAPQAQLLQLLALSPVAVVVVLKLATLALAVLVA